MSKIDFKALGIQIHVLGISARLSEALDLIETVEATYNGPDHDALLAAIGSISIAKARVSQALDLISDKKELRK